MSERPATLRWVGDVWSGWLEVLDQRGLPGQVEVLKLTTVEGVWDAIRTLAVRGAPAIGVAAAYGIVMAARVAAPTGQVGPLLEVLRARADYLKTSRPTAVNLERAVERMIIIAATERGIGVRRLQERLLIEAQAIEAEDAAMCQAIGVHGVRFITAGMGVLTHCNAGSLATSYKDGGGGTALAILYEAQRRGVDFKVYADETRPLLQGARLTTWELMQAGIDVTLICDDMAALLMKQGKVGLVVVGADRIAANGDVANKIGTYGLAVLAAAHAVPLVVAAPSTTFDLDMPDGSGIPIEERNAAEITEGFGRRTAPVGVKVYNPAFDVTPAKLVRAIVTERGVIEPVGAEQVRRLVG